MKSNEIKRWVSFIPSPAFTYRTDCKDGAEVLEALQRAYRAYGINIRPPIQL